MIVKLGYILELGIYNTVVYLLYGLKINLYGNKVNKDSDYIV